MWWRRLQDGVKPVLMQVFNGLRQFLIQEVLLQSVIILVIRLHSMRFCLHLVHQYINLPLELLDLVLLVDDLFRLFLHYAVSRSWSDLLDPCLSIVDFLRTFSRNPAHIQSEYCITIAWWSFLWWISFCAKGRKRFPDRGRTNSRRETSQWFRVLEQTGPVFGMTTSFRGCTQGIMRWNG